MKYQPDNINALQIEKVRKSYAIFLESWFWNIHATINFSYHTHYKISNEHALKLAFIWLKKIKWKYSRTKFAGILFVSKPHHETNPHVHILLTSDNNYNQTLSDISPEELESLWEGDKKYEKTLKNISSKKLEKMRKDQCKVTSDWSNQQISGYLAKEKNLHLYNPDSGDIAFYRQNLLKKMNRWKSIKDNHERSAEKYNKIMGTKNTTKLTTQYSWIEKAIEKRSLC